MKRHAHEVAKICWECLQEFYMGAVPVEGALLDDGRELCLTCLMKEPIVCEPHLPPK